MGTRKDGYTVLEAKPKKEIPHERLRRKWEDNIKTNLEEIGWEERDWIELAQYADKYRALENAVMKLRVP
jgi:hypothetical protein